MSERDDDDRVAEAPRSSEQPAGLFERVRALFGLTPASVRDDIEEAIDESVGAEFTPRTRHPQERAGFARRQGRRRHGAAGRYRRALAGYAFARRAGPVPHGRPFASASLRGDFGRSEG